MTHVSHSSDVRPRGEPNATTKGETVNLNQLITAAATSAAPISLGAAAALYATASADRRTMGLGLAPDTGDMSVTITVDDDYAEASVDNSLRYLLDLSDDTVTRLCTVPDCGGESAGLHIATRTCVNHLDRPYLGHDAAESLRIRLDAWEDEARTGAADNAGHLRVIEKLRGETA